MLDDYIENISQEEIDQIGTQKNFIQHASVQPLTNGYSNMDFSIKDQISKSVPLTLSPAPKSYEEDILEKSSSNIAEQNMNEIPFATSNIIENEVMEQPIEQYITEDPKIINTIPLNNNIAYSEIISNQNNIYTTTQPSDNYNILSEFPTYTVDQNIYQSTPLPQTTNITYTTYPETSNIVTYIDQPSNIFTTFNPNIKKHAEVIPIDDELMKNPQIAKNVRESQMHVNNYLKKFENNSNSFYRSTSKKKKAKNNLYNSININNLKNIKNISDFSPDLYKNFYDKNDPFFRPIPAGEIYHNQIINNTYNNEVYQGDVNSKGQKHGFGKLTTPYMERIGTWKNDRFNGWGREVRKTGEIYEGKFVGDAIRGKGISLEGDVLYIGNMVNNKKHGKGEIFTNDYHYVGDFNNDSIDGKGRIELYDKGVYEGEFMDGYMTGYGVFKYPNGDYYEGEMEEGNMHGLGKFTSKNGKVYEGRFINGKFQGKKNFFKYNDM